MRLDLFRKGLAVILAVMSVFNLTPFSLDSVARWIVGPEYRDAAPQDRVDMILDLYINQDFIYLSDDAESFARTAIAQFLLQIFSGEGDGDKLVEAINELPVYGREGRDTSRESFETDSEENMRIKQTMSKLIEASSLPQNIKDACYYLTDGVNDVYIYFVKTDHEGIYEFAGDCISDSGNVQVGYTGVYYDSETTLIYGFNGRGIFQIGFDCRAGGLTMQNPVNPWQRQYGFNIFFDIIGNILLIDTDTVRVKFEYNGQNKMIQFWKGNYTKISNGAEIGLYNRQEDSVLFYDSVPDEEMLYMSMELYHGDELIMENDRELHWWLTGYVPGPLIDSSELTLKSTIEFTEQGMADAFLESAAKAFGKSAVITNDGLTVNISWQ